MKIAFIVGQFPVLSQTFVINQVMGLIDRGHEVEVFSLEGVSTDVKQHPQIHHYKTLFKSHSSPAVPENYFLRIIKGFYLFGKIGFKTPFLLLSALNFWAYGKEVVSLRALYALPSFLEQKNFDIIHCQFGVYGLQAAVLRDIGAIRGKLIVTFRGFDITEYPQRCGLSVYDRLFEQADLFLTNCDFFRRTTIALGCQSVKIKVLGSGIDCAKFAVVHRCPPKNEATKIVTVGRLVEKKGIEYGIRAIALLVAEGIRVEYYIVGDGTLAQSLIDLTQDLECAQQVQFLGWQDQSEIILLLQKSHVLIAPSVTASNGDQDAPVNTLKEAMAMGMPVIGTQHGGIPELIQSGVSGFLVPERDSVAIADQLKYLIEHPEIWPSLGRAGRDFVEKHYDMEILNDKLVEIYQRLLMPSRNGKDV